MFDMFLSRILDLFSFSFTFQGRVIALFSNFIIAARAIARTMSYAQTNQGYPPASGGGQYQPPPQQQPPGPRPPPGMMAPPPYGGAPMMPPPMGQQGPPGTPLVCRTSREPVGIGAKFNPRGYSKRQEGPPPKYLPPSMFYIG